MNISNKLTNEETKLFEMVLESLRFQQKNTIARVAGGWVRDKLLGRSSDDIDIALDDQSGEEFAHGVNNYLKHLGKTVRTIAIIQVRNAIIRLNQSAFQYLASYYLLI